MTIKQIKKLLKEMKVVFDEFSFISERVPNLVFTFCKNKEFSTRYFLITDFGLTEISKSTFYQLGQKALVL